MHRGFYTQASHGGMSLGTHPRGLMMQEAPSFEAFQSLVGTEIDGVRLVGVGRLPPTPARTKPWYVLDFVMGDRALRLSALGSHLYFGDFQDDDFQNYHAIRARYAWLFARDILMHTS